MNGSVNLLDCNRFAPVNTILLGIFLYTIAAITILGNILVLVSFLRYRSLRSFGNYFIFNLSMSDLIIGSLMLVYIPYVLTGCWELTRSGCIAFNVIDYAVPLSSTWNIALISMDRFWSVTKPITYRVKQSPKKAIGLMFIPWLIGFVFYAPSVIGWEHWTGRQKVPDDKCFVEFFDNVPLLLCNSVIEFIIPFVLVLTINIMIYMNIRQRSRGLKASKTQTSGQAASLSRDQRTARALAILVGIFLMTWAPYEVVALVNPLCQFCVPDTVFDVVFWLLWLNSTVNPLIYALLQLRFRKAFLSILFCGKYNTNSVKPMPKLSLVTVST